MLVAFWASNCLGAATEQKIALVIGNSAYPGAALRNPVNDANAMAAKLGSLGFEVILRTNASQREMTRAVSQFGQKLKGGSVGLFYFAGHGLQVRGKNFLIPVDAEIENEASTRSEAVDVDQVLEQLGSARLSMVILDACRNNPFERRFRSSGSGGLAQIDAPTGTMLAYATAPGKVAFDGTGVNGLYTTELLKALDTPGLKVEDVFKQVRINVLKASDNQQIPWESSSLTGEFYFKPALRPQVADVNAQQSARERAELQKALEDERRRRDHDAKTQADLQRSLEDERRRRDQDADILRKEMEKLRAELLRLSESAGSAKPVSSAPTAPVAAAQVPKPAPSSTAQNPPTQVALAVTTAPVQTDTPARNTEWASRIALLNQLKGKLTFGKAVAALLNITDGEDLTRLLTLEQRITRAAWANAHAMGVDSAGRLGWAGVERFPNAPGASSLSLEFCGSDNRRRCRAVVVNGEFKEKEFVELANELSRADFSTARLSYLDTLRNLPREMVFTPVGGGTLATQQAMVFISTAPPSQISAGAATGTTANPLPILSAEATEGWNKRIALLAQLKGKLTYAKAFAILLDISAANDLGELVGFENLLSQAAWSSAHAMGLDTQGNPHWAYGGRFVNALYGRNEVLEFCNRNSNSPCKTLVVNRELQEKEFFELADQFKKLELAPPAAVLSG